MVKQVVFAVTSQVDKRTLLVDLREALKLESCGFLIDQSKILQPIYLTLCDKVIKEGVAAIFCSTVCDPGTTDD